MSEQAETAASDSAPESLVGLLNQLVEPETPAAIPMTPQTAGWAVLLVLVLAAFLAGCLWGVRRWKSNAYRRAALEMLDAAGDSAPEIASILRRTALAAWPRSEVANLAGDKWLAFLNETGGHGAFSGSAAQTLIEAPYDKRVGPAPQDLQSAARHWVRMHKVAQTGGEG